MGRFFVVLVLAVSLQVATAVGSDRGDDTRQAEEATAVGEGQVEEGRVEEALAGVDGQPSAVLEGQATAAVESQAEDALSSSSHSDAAQELLDQAEMDAEEEKKEAQRQKAEEARRKKADERRRAEEERRRREAAQRRAEEEQKRSEQRRQQQLEQQQQEEQMQREFQSAVESEVARRLAAARSEQQNVPFVFSLLSAVTTAIDELREERRQAAIATTAQLKRLGEILQGNQELHARQLELVASMMGRELVEGRARARAPPRTRCNRCVACTVTPIAGTRRAPCLTWRSQREEGAGSAPGTPGRGPDGRFVPTKRPAPASPLPEALSGGASPGPLPGEASPFPPVPAGAEKKEREKKDKKKDKKKKQKTAEAGDRETIPDRNPDEPPEDPEGPPGGAISSLVAVV